MRKHLSFVLSLVLALPWNAFAKDNMDPFDAIVQKLTDKAASKLTDKKIAVLGFDYIDGRKSPGGRVVAEKLTNRFVEDGKFEVIERSMVQKVISELEFQNSATINPETARSLGKGLGVEAIVTGTLEDVGRGKVEIGARMIKTESYQIMAASVQKVHKTWQDGEAPAVKTAQASESAPPESQSAPVEPVFVPTKFQRLKTHLHGFFDFMMGSSNSKIDLSIENPQRLTFESEVGLDVNGNLADNASFRSLSFSGLQTDSSVPIGFRAGVYGDVFGGAFEMSYYSHAIKPQNTTYTLNGVNRGGFRFTREYLKVSVLNILTGDLFVKIPTSDRIFPYLGFGLGMTLNTVSSSYLKQNAGGIVSASLSETAPGFTYRIPIGVRAMFNDNFGMFGEWRYNYNTFTFNRNIASENDKITMTGSQFLLGLSLVF